MELVERDEPLAALAGWLGEAGSGVGRMVLIAGEAGIGKTSLVQAFCDGHRDQARVWRGACDALSTPRPLAPLHDIARTARGSLAALMAGDVSRHERFSGFLEALAGPLQPTIAVIEDVHWADEATRDLLVFLARRIGDVNALLLVTYRDDEVGTNHPLRQVLGSVATLPSVERWTLARLSKRAVGLLAEGRHPDIDDLLRVTGGNPFFVTEVLSSGTGVVPSTVSDAVLARLQGLSGAAREAAEAASVVPDQAEVDLVTTLVGDDGAAVGGCVDAGLLVEDGRFVRFRHELARLAVEDSIPELRGERLHAAVLAWLSRSSDADPARLAYHAGEAGDHEAVLRHAPVAAHRAATMGAHHESYAHLSHAIGHAAELPHAARVDLLQRFTVTCSAIGRFDEALGAAEEGLRLLNTLDDPSATARLRMRRVTLLWNLARNREAHELADEVVASLDARVPTGPAHLYVLGLAAQLRMLARDIPAAMDLADRALALADHLDADEEFEGPADRSAALAALGAAQWFVAPDEAEVTLCRALALSKDAGDEARYASVLGNLGSGAGEVRRYEVADRWLETCIDWCEARDLDYQAGYARAWAARSAFEQGRWGVASDELGRLDRRTIEDRPTRIVALTVLGRLRTRRGAAGAHEALEAAWQLAELTGDLQRTWPVVAGVAEWTWLTTGAVTPDDGLVGVFARAVDLEQAWAIGELGFWLWRAGVISDPPEGAAEPFALQMVGDWRGAAAAWEDIGCPYEVAVALADGDDPDALRRALKILGELGAAPMGDLVAARLRSLGVRDLPRRPSRATVDNPGGLTARQLEVLGLLVEGRTNPQIAAALHISPKTVGHHVSAILDKLGVPDRHAAARIAREQGLAPG